jgi:nitrous oxide reductase accessory protein NosL
MDCTVQHPLMPPDNRYPGQCPVCGMVRPMWARTWITFDAHRDVSQVCSFHCLADWIIKSGHEPANVKLTVYHQPDRMVPAEAAVIVMGSAAKGTMSPVSKIVFADPTTAESFARTCGGEVVTYRRALAVATSKVTNENKMINSRRLKKGKIVEPAEDDHCPVCNMLPARYPYGKCQIKPRQGDTIHFCSTQCLFAFLGKPERYVPAPIDPLLVWVVDRETGMWISGRTAFYVVGSTKVLGPMGYEALPFNSLAAAEAFASSNGGKAMNFKDVSIYTVVPQWKYSK